MQSPLQPAMQPTPGADPSARSTNFAAVLAALTAAKAQTRGEAAEWDKLEDDVATLSYESALRTHARYRPAKERERLVHSADGMNAEGTNFGSDADQAIFANPAGEADELPSQAATAGAHRTGSSPVSTGQLSTGLAATSPVSTNADRSRKRASVTVRLTEAELTQLHARAAEAGLTVSAYLRSCTFEVEALRAQVKQMVAELRQPQAKPPEREAQPRRRWLWVSPRGQRQVSA